MKKWNILLIGLIILLLSACGGKERTAGNKHEHGDVSLSHTVWTDKTELFVNFRPLVVGKLITFEACFTEMQNYKAITEGKVTVSLIKENKGVRSSVDEPISLGIFKPAIEPTKAGIFDLIFEIETTEFTDQLTIRNVEVYASEKEAYEQIHPVEEDPSQINFSKEQAWSIEFTNAEVKRGTIYEVIKTGGEIIAAQGDEQTITATTNGVVVYHSNISVVGEKVSKGQTMFTISGGSITNDNVETEFLKVKSKYSLAKSQYERKKELYEEQIISKSEFESVQLEYELVKTEYFNLSKNFSKSGKTILAPMEGYIKSFLKKEGEYVEVGETLAVLTQNKKLTIKADVSQVDFKKLDNSISANFSFNNGVYSIEEFNGSLLSFGKSVSQEYPKIPIYFEIDNTGELLSGSFIEVWIKTNSKHNALVVPATALLENFGSYSLIIQNDAENFENREVQIGISDGKYVEVLSGVKAGERIVTKGAYQVKMASMSNQAPSHGHSH